jgi:release factor glutamine methyltransferase
MFLNLRQAIAAWLIRKIQRYGPHKVKVLGKTYEISQEVFNPKFYYTSKFMAKHLKVTPRDEVLDMGTGCGIQAITAGQIARRVIAVDINPEAVQFAWKNVKANGLENKVSVLQGDLFSPLRPRQRFDIILFTPPYMEGKPKTGFDHALFDPDKKLIRRFFEEARGYLKPNGYVQMVYSSIAEPERALKISNEFGWKWTLIAQGKTLMESFLIYKLTLEV